jgi:hypothetical protein
MLDFLFELALNLVIALFGAFVAAFVASNIISVFELERPPKVLIISKSLWNIQALFVALQNKYKDHRCVYFTQDRFDKWILFEDDENWTIISYYSKLIRQNEINYNEYDKIVFDINLPEDFTREVVSKVKDHSIIKVCDLKKVINKVGGC